MPLPPPQHARTPAAVENHTPELIDEEEDEALGYHNAPGTSTRTAAANFFQWLGSLFMPPRQRPIAAYGLRLVMLSDTHGSHRKLQVPPGDVLIHAGDMTRMGLIEDAEDFNEWLATLPHTHKVVVNGNHEANAAWKKRASDVFSNATLLKDTAITLQTPKKTPLTVHGTEFAWPMKSANPNYDAIAGSVDVLVAHGPVNGYVDGGKGCSELRRLVERLKPRVVVGGHIHSAHGVQQGSFGLTSTTFVNAANAKDSHSHMGWDPIVLDI